MWVRIKTHWFLVSLGASFAIGYFASERLGFLLEMGLLRHAIVFVVMWAMGVTLRADAVGASLRRPLPTLLAIAINIFLVPILCWPTQVLLSPAMFGGLFVTSLVPCTLASASVWTRKAGGDDSIALMTTVVTNLACVIVIPIGVALVLTQTADVSVSEQMRSLAMVVVAPLALAPIVRRAGLATWADKNKSRLSTAAQIGILVMVMIGAIKSASVVNMHSGREDASTWSSLLIVLGLVSVVHTGALWIGVFAARLVGADRASQIAVGISGSQKTLMVGLQIAIDCGVSVVPMLMYHLAQLFIDTIIANRWSRKKLGVKSRSQSK